METQIIMDRNGDTRHEFNTSDQASVLRAEARFRELTLLRGFRAVALGSQGEAGRILDRFDPHAERTLFIPNLQGG